MSLKHRNLQDTSDVDPILSDSFLANGVFSDLYFYPNEFRVVQKNSVKTISIDFDLTFSIIKNNDKPIGLELIKQNERIQFTRDFGFRAQQWENVLLCYLTRKDFHQFFRPLKKIGKGNFATVYLAEDIHRNRDVAIKAFMKEKAFLQNGKKAIQNEIKVLRRIKSDHIVKLYGVYSTPNSLYLSMEHINGVTLQTYLKKSEKMNIYQRKKLLTSLLIALKDLKSLRIVHRDIKPDNILVSFNLALVKLVDFGLATSIDEPNYIFIRCGTPGYVAPEILRIRDLSTVRLGYQSDMFSLGAIYYQILYGKPLFPGKDQTEVLQSNRVCRIRCQQIEDSVYGQVQLLRCMLQIDPKLRITPEQALQSEFLSVKKSLTDRRKILAPIHLKFEESQWTDLQ